MSTAFQMRSAASFARRPLAERSIRVLVSPAPITFAERRSVLQALEQYGPVEVFQMDKHANFLSVTRETTTATRLIASSPIVYRMTAPPIKTDINIADLEEGDSSNTFSSHKPRLSRVNSFREQSSTNDDDGAASGDGVSSPYGQHQEEEAVSQFQLDIYPHPSYVHEFAMSRSPLYHSWPTSYVRDKSLATSILKHSVPQTMASEGLAHWLLEPGCLSISKTYGSTFDRRLWQTWLPSRLSKRHAR
ncbi:hypothetical protein E4U55_007621 [Claviceps digitariae]|nr:hypothetical protein E4U55_007621 [Claviceps digitariae]